MTNQSSSLRSPFAVICLLVAAFFPALEMRAEEPAKPAPEVTLEPRCGLPFQDNAVLQQKIPLPVWGWSLPEAKVTVAFDGQTKTAVAGKDGAWRVTLDPMTAIPLASVNEAPAGKAMLITCEKDGEKAVRKIENLLVGEVWLCAGQSNMAGNMRTNKSRHFPEDSIEKADYPALRQMVSPAHEPWLVCSPETAPDIKKVCFFFGRRVQADILVPVGVINVAVGGSNIESWLNGGGYETGKNYKQMLAPLVGYGIRGAVWYQGESNEKDRRAYAPKLKALIEGWRKDWSQPDSAASDGPRSDFSFYFVQLPGISTSPTDNPAGGDGRAEIRQAQAEALALENTGMAVTLDIGDEKEHPPNKYDTGVRLAHLALHRDYGFGDLVPSGPLYKDHAIEGGKIRIRFDHADGGLILAEKAGFLPPVPKPGSKLAWLSIQAKDGTWHWADGALDGADLVVSSKDVADPIAVRYAYTTHPEGTLLYNKEGLPSAPFSTSGYDPEQ